MASFEDWVKRLIGNCRGPVEAFSVEPEAEAMAWSDMVNRALHCRGGYRSHQQKFQIQRSSPKGRISIVGNLTLPLCLGEM